MPANPPSVTESARTELEKLIEARGKASPGEWAPLRENHFSSDRKFCAAAANWVSDHAQSLLAERERYRARIERLERAVRPFADLANQIDAWGHEDDSTCEHRIRATDLRRARAALADGGQA